jgi:hypothetical protein
VTDISVLWPPHTLLLSWGALLKCSQPSPFQNLFPNLGSRGRGWTRLYQDPRRLHGIFEGYVLGASIDIHPPLPSHTPSLNGPFMQHLESMAASLFNMFLPSPHPLFLLLLLLLLLLPSTTAIQVAPSSPCAPICLDSPDGDSTRAAASTTNSSDIVCNDIDYFSSVRGQKFKDCITCLQTSTATSGGENDVSWFLCKQAVTERRSLTVRL